MRKIRLVFILAVLLLSACCGIASANELPAAELQLASAEVDLAFTYSHYSKNRLVVNGYSLWDVIIIGRLQVDEIDRDLLVPQATLRLKLCPEASIEAVVPYRYRVDDRLKYADGGREEIIREVGIGDVELLLNLKTKSNSPWMTTLGIKIPTGLDPYEADSDQVPLGTGHWGGKVSVTKMKAIDPAVLFGGLSYITNSARQMPEYGTVDPGDTIQYSLGMAVALNQRIAVNARLEHGFTSETTINGVPELGSRMNAATIFLGSTYTTEKGRPIDFSVGAGLTEDAPDVTVKVSWSL